MTEEKPPSIAPIYKCPRCGQPCKPDEPCPQCQQREDDQELFDSYRTLTLAASMMNIVRSFKTKDLKAIATLVQVCETVMVDEDWQRRFYNVYSICKHEYDKLVARTPRIEIAKGLGIDA